MHEYIPLFKTGVFEWSAKSRDFTIWIPDNHTIQYSGESSIQVFSIQMVTVLKTLTKVWKIWDSVYTLRLHSTNLLPAAAGLSVLGLGGLRADWEIRSFCLAPGNNSFEFLFCLVFILSRRI